MFHFLRSDIGLSGHCAESPVMRRYAISDCQVKGIVGVMSWTVHSMNQQRPLLAAPSVTSVTRRAILDKQIGSLGRIALGIAQRRLRPLPSRVRAFAVAGSETEQQDQPCN